MLDVKAPVEVSEVVPVFRSGAPYVSATFTNQTPLPQSVTAELRLVGSPGDRPSARVNLPPGVSAVKLFDCAPFAPTGGDKYVARIKTTTAGGYTTSSDYSVTFAPVSFVTVPPALDAPLDSWSALPAITVAGRSHVIRSTDYYNGKLAVSAKFAWDSTNLYVAFDVTDPVYIQTHTGWETWKGDCIQLEFNLDPDRKAETTGNLVIDAGMVRTSEIDIALTATGPEAYRTHSYSASQAPEGQLTQEQLRLKVMQTASGLQYRAAIPWKTLGANKAPVSGQRIGFSAFINDMNQPGQLDPTAIGLYAEAVSRDSSKFGTLVLLASGK